MNNILNKHEIFESLYLAALKAGREMENDFLNLSCLVSNWNIIHCNVKFTENKML